jgi:hypothetical protein
LPEEWLTERFQQVGTTSGELFCPSFSPIFPGFAAFFRNLRYVFVTVRSTLFCPSLVSQFRLPRARPQRSDLTFDSAFKGIPVRIMTWQVDLYKQEAGSAPVEEFLDDLPKQQRERRK